MSKGIPNSPDAPRAGPQRFVGRMAALPALTFGDLALKFESRKMSQGRYILFLAGLMALPFGPADAAPKPALALGHWQLDFAFHDPARISVTLPGDDRPSTVWYVLYSVTNLTGREVDFYPVFDLVTDTFQVVEGGRGIHPDVYQAIRDRHARQYPFFTMPKDVLGTLRQGEDNTRTAAIAFRDFDPQASRFTVYVAGLSGEMARVANPTFNRDLPESDNNRPFFVLRKTLAVTYELPGDAQSRNLADPIRVKREWVMR
ncbi:MAG: hypothetical protein ACE5GE_01945 [Phycisphaerae bacterium]